MNKGFIPTYIQSPCWNYEEGCDCKHRSIDCHGRCDKWNDYVKERDRRYAERVETVQLNSALSDMHNTRRTRHSNVVDAFKSRGKKVFNK